MENLIGKPFIFQTIRKPMRNKTLKPIFPEHIFSATILQFMGDYALIENIKLLVSEGEYNGDYGRNLTLLARDKLLNGNMNGNGLVKTSNNNITYLIKVANNLYFNVYIYNQNIDLLESIQNHGWFPKLYDLCFYQLSTSEISFSHELFNIY
jgi:hypothetical protein|tara:strand:+ start:76 stop:531 length:456 start_codon:yes stop_codon:yes gene_type:complete